MTKYSKEHQAKLSVIFFPFFFNSDRGHEIHSAVPLNESVVFLAIMGDTSDFQINLC